MFNYRTITVLGFLLTLLVHFGLIQALNLAPPEEDVEAALTEPVVTTIRQQDVLQKWESELLAWAEMADPTFITVPHTDSGFSSVRTGKILKSDPAWPAYKQPKYSVAKPAFKNNFSVAQPLDLAATGSVALQFAKDPLGLVAKTKQFPDKIIWRTQSGNTIEHMPRQLPDSILAEARSKPPGGPTVIEIIKMRKTVRLRMTESSGNTVLDEFALRLLGKKTAIAESTAEFTEQESDTPFFPQPQRSNIIEIEWRLALPAESAASDKETE
ncbi:MAG: hypothetical protein R6V56_00355 [Lentisphaeria bacterium]